MRILALDYGQARIGVAISDPSGTLASPVETIWCRPKKSGSRDSADQSAISRIQALYVELAAQTIVIGLPTTLSGRKDQAVSAVEAFVGKLKKALSVPIIFWDERLTTAMAERALIQMNVRRDKRRDIVDQAAATLILQSYLDSLTTPLTNTSIKSD